MIRIHESDVYGFEHAIRGMRNPKNSWKESDSQFLSCAEMKDCNKCFYVDPENDGSDGLTTVCHAPDGIKNVVIIGPKDWKLMTKLRNAGTDHRKFMRMIVVYADITAPLYWWKEFDTYKVGTVANSCSTMHKLTEKEFELKDFSTEHLTKGFIEDVMMPLINALNNARSAYTNYEVYKSLDESTMKDGLLSQKDIWWQMIQILPASYNQKRTVMLNYEVLANIYESRQNHKLDEWRDFILWAKTLPYSELITGEEDE